MAQSQGGGPAGQLAQNQLQQATNQNVQQAAGLAASQKGMNPALAARQILNQTGAINQGAANQAAQLQGNVALNSQGQAANLLNTQAQQGLQSQQIGQQGALGAGAQNLQAQGINTNANLQAQGINAGIAAGNANQNANTAGGIVGGIASAGASLLGLAEGGKVPSRTKMAKGGSLGSPVSTAIPGVNTGIIDYSNKGPGMGAGLSSVGDLAGALVKRATAQPSQTDLNYTMPAIGSSYAAAQNAAPSLGVDTGPAAPTASPMGIGSFQPTTPFAGFPGVPTLARGGKVPAMVSPGERYLPPKDVKQVLEGKKEPMKAGERIPGKPVVGGAKNSYANDTVPKTLQEGGVVIPRSVTQAKDAPEKAEEFVKEKAHMAEGGKAAEFMSALKGTKPKKSLMEPTEGYSKVLHRQREIENRLKQLEALASKHGVR